MASNEKIAFCQVDAHLDTNPKIRKAGRNGREVFLFILRRVAIARADGEISIRFVDPDYLADQLMMTASDASDGLASAVTAGLLVCQHDFGTLRVVGWTPEWGRFGKSGAQRQAEYMSRKSAKSNNRVTDSDGRPSSSVSGDENDGSDKKRSYTEGPNPGGSDPLSTPGGPKPIDVLKDKVKDAVAKKAAKVPEQAWRAADRLRALVLEDDASAIVGNREWGDDVKSGLRLEWADEIRKMVAYDHRTYEQIDEVMEWLFHGQTSAYRFIVQSASALRAKWDSIRANRRTHEERSGKDERPRMNDL